MNIFYTILASVFVFVLGQIVLRFLIEPVQAFKVTIGEVAHKLILHTNLYANPKPRGDNKQQDEAFREFRELASKLQSSIYLIPYYNISSKIFALPTQQKVIEACGNLIAIYNGVDNKHPHQGVQNFCNANDVRSNLGIFIPEDERLNTEDMRESIKGKNT